MRCALRPSITCCLIHSRWIWQAEGVVFEAATAAKAGGRGRQSTNRFSKAPIDSVPRIIYAARLGVKGQSQWGVCKLASACLQ